MMCHDKHREGKREADNVQDLEMQIENSEREDKEVKITFNPHNALLFIFF